MDNDQPMMLLRARIHADVCEEFDRWFKSTHLEEVRAIPGIVEVRAGTAPDGLRLGIYFFINADSVQPALASPAAVAARASWERWQPHLQEMSVEFWAAVTPTPLFEEIN